MEYRMPVTYAVYQVEPGGYADEPLTAGVAPDLETATRRTELGYFKGREPETKVVDEITADITVRKPQYARYKVIVLKSD
jgi:hypothetical protein